MKLILACSLIRLTQDIYKLKVRETKYFVILRIYIYKILIDYLNKRNFKLKI